MSVSKRDKGRRPSDFFRLGARRVGSLSRADRKRALYPGARPTAEAKAIHRRFVSGPLPRVLPIAAVVEVRGRISGRTIAVPLATVRYHGCWYLVSMLGERSNWVGNVRAADGNVTLTHCRRRPVHLVEVPPAVRAPIIKRYLLFAISARPHVEVSWRAPLTQFQHIAVRYPVFRVDKRQ